MAVELEEHDFRNLAENLPALCWIGAPDGAVLWYNRTWYDYTGFQPGDTDGWDWEKAHDPDVLPEVARRWRAAIETGQRAEMTFPLRGADGVFRPFLTRVTPHRNAEGEIVRWFGISTDVSEFRAIETRLRDSEARYRSAMTLGRMGAWEVDLSTGRRKWTPEGMAVFGIDLPDQVKVHETVVDGGHNRVGPGNRRAGDRIVTSGRIDHDEIRAAADPGHFLVQARRCHQAERDMPRRGQINLPPACRGFAIVEIACHGLLAGIKVNRCNAVAGALQRNRSMHRRRRLSRAALFIGEDNYVRVLRHRC